MGTLLHGREKKFFDSISVEVLRLVGADNPILWKFVQFPKKVDAELAVDCLYEEPVPTYSSVQAGKVKHYVPYNVLVHFEEPTSVREVSDNGLIVKNEMVAFFSRKNLEDAKVIQDDNGDHVEEGDILQLFNKGQGPGKNWFYEIINVERVGFEHDSETWTHYRVDLIRNESFTPERKIVK